MELSQLQAFVAVVDHGSFLVASKALGPSRATLRGRVDSLEAHLGGQLLVRTHQGARCTELGERVLPQARALLRAAQALEASARDRDGGRTVLRLLVPVGPPPSLTLLVSALLVERLPELQLFVDQSRAPLREDLDGYDLIVAFDGPLPQGPYRTFAVLHMPEVLLASPAYLATRGRPETVGELAGHELLSWTADGDDGTCWALRDGGSLTVQPRIRSPDIHAVRSLAVAGRGIARLPNPAATWGPVPGDDLEPVLPQLVGRELVLRVLLPEARANTARVRAMVEVFREVLGNDLVLD